ncbi:MAG TPA: hypothetical protein VF407_22925 [Polyangiaceae bacterium]
MKLSLLTAASVLVLAACASNPPPAATAPDPAPASSATTTAATVSEAPPSNVIHRSDVHRVVAKGPGAFLSRVELDSKPVKTADGKFVGFRIAALKGDGWKGVDLKPGDVVKSVNGFPIERPEQALEAFQSLDVASELRVNVQRDGADHELRYAIVDP